jgi:drug/metabolite transporter (DMT)-like permease
MLSVLAVLGMLGFAGRDLASRMAPATLNTSILGLYGFLSLALSGLLYQIWEGQALIRPAASDFPVLACIVLVGVCAYSSLMKAMRTGEVSAVTPFRYSRLLFGVGIGVVFFDEGFDHYMAIGSGLIVLSGLFILWRGKRS